MSKRIICTVTNDLTYDQRMIRICTTLANQGYEVLLVGRVRYNSIDLISQPFEQQRLRCWFNKKAVFYLEYNLRLFFFLLLRRADLFYAIDLDTLLPNFLVSRAKRKPLVYDAHEFLTELPELVERRWVKSVRSLLANSLIPKVKYAITVGTALSEALEVKYGVSFEVIRNMPIAQNIFEQVPKIQPPVLFYQGALNDGRGIEELMTAMQFIENAQLWIVGEGDLSDFLRTYKTQLKLGDKVQFLGYQTPKALRHITPQATIGLNLLQNKGLNYYYSLANKAFDYVQAAVPSINMRFPEYVHLNNTYQVFELVDDLSPTTLVAAIDKLLHDTKHYQQLVANCREARQQWTWQHEEKRLVTFIQGILQDVE